MVALLKSLKNIYVLIFRIHIPKSIFKSNKELEDGFWNVTPKY